MSAAAVESLPIAIQNIGCLKINEMENDENRLPDSPLTVEHFSIIKHIGSGAYGEVAAVRKKTGKDKDVVYAMKAMDKKKMSKHKDMVDHEHNILCTIKNPFFMTMMYSFQSARHLIFIMPLAGGGDLLTKLSEIGVGDDFMKEEEAFFYLCELVEGVGYLHLKKILHRDLKLENLLIANDGHLLITDYGLSATSVHSDNSAEGTVGTRHTMAPEIHLKQYYGPAADWWAVGVTYCDMRSNKPLWPGERSIDYSKNTVSKRPKLPAELSAKEREFLKKIFVADQTLRLGYGENGTENIKQAFIFKNVTWEDVVEKKLTPPFIPDADAISTLKCFPEEAKGKNKFPDFTHSTPLYWPDIDYTSPELL